MSTDRRPLLLMSPALLWLFGFMVVPCLLILVLAFFRRGIYGGIEYTWTFENIALVFDPLYFQIFLKSAGIAGLSAAIACVLGYAAAYAIAAMPRRHQPMLLFFAVLPFWSNYLVRTYAWIVLLNREGLVVNLARWIGFEGELPSMLYTEQAVVIGLVYNYLPFVILSCYAPLSRLNPEIAEASRDLGASGWTTFRRVTLPMTVPGIATGFVFVFVLSIGNFVTPALAGRRAVPDDRQPGLCAVPDRERLAFRRGAVDGSDPRDAGASDAAGRGGRTRVGRERGAAWLSATPSA